MKDGNDEVYEKLTRIYRKYLKKRRKNPDSGQMCLMWSINNPPDTIFETDPIYEIEDVFGITLSEIDCEDLYDMNLEEAAMKIGNLIKE